MPACTGKDASLLIPASTIFEVPASALTVRLQVYSLYLQLNSIVSFTCSCRQFYRSLPPRIDLTSALVVPRHYPFKPSTSSPSGCQTFTRLKAQRPCFYNCCTLGGSVSGDRCPNFIQSVKILHYRSSVPITTVLLASAAVRFQGSESR